MIRPVVLAVVVLATAACSGNSGDDSGPALSLSPEGLAGREVFRDQNCQSCHGADGEGNIGPSLQNLAGQPVELDNGETVIADDEYLTRAIREPDAERVDGYNVPMPDNNLSDEELASVLAFIHDLGGEAAE